MSKRRMLLLGLLVFIAVLALAIVYQSSTLLYLASVIPLLIVPFLPDLQAHQYLKANRPKGKAQIMRLAGTVPSDSDLLVITFQPGTIKWNKKLLYVSVKEIPAFDKLVSQESTISIPVLLHDLVPHPRRRNSFGIRLDQVKARTVGQSYSIDKVNRFSMRMVDLQQFISPGTPFIPSQNKGMQA